VLRDGRDDEQSNRLFGSLENAAELTLTDARLLLLPVRSYAGTFALLTCPLVLERLKRDQLQGVLAHELSHVKNYDIRFMTLMAVLVGTVVMLAHIGTRAMWYGGGRRRSRSSGGGGAAMLIVFIVAIVLAIVAPILARLIQMAVSRQREFLADASAAHMTRYPEGLASALEALRADTHEMPQANGANAHLFIHEPRMARSGGRKSHGRWWSSHPPVAERVERLRSIGNIGA
jgi:heat shock protein HtpX